MGRDGLIESKVSGSGGLFKAPRSVLFALMGLGDGEDELAVFALDRADDDVAAVQVDDRADDVEPCLLYTSRCV